ncbi:hypothetical protein AAF712_002237 [Marasmius tenuissimus]|uniref:Uncharacterized protein n=1 Tax=Marasmius tenuissimus TaxID=585030 RepID=A0ABR3A939_9AGAR
MAGSPFSTSDSERRQAIIRFVGHHEQVLETNRGLMRAESDRQSAAQNLQAAEDRVQTTVHELDARFDAMAKAYADLKLVFSTENSQPSGSTSTVVPPSTPSRPRRIPMSTQPPSSPNVQGHSTSTPSQPPPPTATQGNYPAYVVYCGKDGVTGIFYSWYDRRGLEGAKQHVTLDHHLVKGFGDVELAQEFYGEFASSSAATALATPIGQYETFVLLEGVLPGVYYNRKTLLWKGLQFRGGVVEVFTGSGCVARARNRFTQAEGTNEIRVTHQPQQID